MSSFILEVCPVSSVKPHDNADNLEILTIKGWQVVCRKGQFREGQNVIYFPPDSILSTELADRYGVTKYLGQSYMGLKVKAARLRGVASFGFCVETNLPMGADLSFLGVQKYVPIISNEADEEVPHPAFHPYTDIENIRNFPGILQDEEEVIFTEKIHGQNFRCGFFREFMVGSRTVRKREGENKWWASFTEPMRALLKELGSGSILFGEKYGPGIQDMTYGESVPKVRFFDIAVDMNYLDYDVKTKLFEKYVLDTVPVLYRGGFSQSIMNEYTDGNTTLSENPGKFKGREGIVITPTTERRCEIGRVIFKSISVDYLSRKNPKDN